MKLILFIAKSIAKLWKFFSIIMTISLIGIIILLSLSIIMPENVQKLLEIFRNIF
jgi:LPS O-antigen subunit length determinant protein (WzzB/FepE family)